MLHRNDLCNISRLEKLMQNFNHSAIAAFIGARLQHPNPPCNGLGRVSSIKVAQYKTKFDSVRIYCNLANDKLIDDEWRSRHDCEPTQEFIDKCWERDAEHYRRCYVEMVELLNGYAAFFDGADYYVLLCASEEELDAVIESRNVNECHCGIYDGPSISGRKFSSYDELKECVKKVMRRVPGPVYNVER